MIKTNRSLFVIKIFVQLNQRISNFAHSAITNIFKKYGLHVGYVRRLKTYVIGGCLIYNKLNNLCDYETQKLSEMHYNFVIDACVPNVIY